MIEFYKIGSEEYNRLASPDAKCVHGKEFDDGLAGFVENDDATSIACCVMSLEADGVEIEILIPA